RVCPSVCPLTLGVPIRVLLYFSCPHQSAPLHQVSPSHCHLSSGIPVKSAPLPSKYPFLLYFPIRVPLYTIFPIRVPLCITCAHQSDPFHSMCPFMLLTIKYAHQSAP
ncbi:unnamed protein product, partial [Staurois parvus]